VPGDYKAKNWSKKRQLEIGKEPGSRGIAIVISCYEATTSEDTTGWKILSVIFQSADVVLVVQLFVVKTCILSINPTSNPNPRR
jgi:hypothetical protein